MHDSFQLSQARQRLILERLTQGQSVVAAGLASEFSVSEDTIRRDLRQLADRGLCVRVYGGALPISPASSPLEVRASEDIERKRDLARAAMPLVTPRQTIFIDTSGTTLHFAPLLPQDFGLTVITHSLPIAAALMGRSDITLTLIGGSYDRATGGCFGSRSFDELRRLHIDLLVLGACALSAREGLSAFGSVDADFKAALLEQSKAAMLMMTNNKLETTAPFRIAPVSAISRFVLEHDADEAIIEGLHAVGCNIIQAAPPS